MKAFIEFAKALADSSATIINQYYRTGVAVDLKADQSPVTIADKKAEETMREQIMRVFPDHGIVGEEFGLHNPDAEFQWMLDPIDGTKNFVSGTPLFGTLIALVKDGRPILGVINLPVLGDCLIGADGEARLNGETVSVRECSSIEQATVLATSHWGVYKHQNGAAFEALTRRAKLYRTWGDCYGYYLVATGFADIMLDPIMNPWDFMALVPIIEGAGGKITDWQGNDVVLGQSTVATAGTLHDEVIRALNS